MIDIGQGITALTTLEFLMKRLIHTGALTDDDVDDIMGAVLDANNDPDDPVHLLARQMSERLRISE